MTRKHAEKILGLHNAYTRDEIKKKYRLIMKQIHPDITSDHNYPYEVSDINAAYEALINGTYDGLEDINESYRSSDRKRGNSRRADSIKWNAAVNNNAFCDRDIYYNVEDPDGEIIGQAVIDCGKFIWSVDEEFNLFLKSLYECSKRIVTEDDELKGLDRTHDIVLQAEISYLLAQQFVDTRMVLDNSSLVGRVGEETYLIDAMVEDVDGVTRFKEGEFLVPGKVIKHRLYLNNANGKEVGYLSFRDDRMYYGIVPLFERRAVQLKVQINDAVVKLQRGKRYIEVSLMMRMLPEDKNQMIENINGKIISILNK